MAKEIAKDTRAVIHYDENGYRLRASCVCFKDDSKQKVRCV